MAHCVQLMSWLIGDGGIWGNDRATCLRRDGSAVPGGPSWRLPLAPRQGSNFRGHCSWRAKSGEADPAEGGLMLPASMGLRFQVPSDLESVGVTVRNPGEGAATQQVQIGVPWRVLQHRRSSRGTEPQRQNQAHAYSAPGSLHRHLRISERPSRAMIRTCGWPSAG
jgi:hypothetical protein